MYITPNVRSQPNQRQGWVPVRMSAQTVLFCALGIVSSLSYSQSDASVIDLQNRQRLDQAIVAMKQPHEIVPDGLVIKGGWHLGPVVMMGTEPYAHAIPGWWKGIRHTEWRSLAAWFTAYVDARGETGGNTGIEIGGIEVWVQLESTGQWSLLKAQRDPAWEDAYSPNAIESFSKSGGIRLADGAFVAIPTRAQMVHGGLRQVPVPWADRADIRALLVSVRHRLRQIDPAGPDKREQAHFGVMAGADYYPFLGAKLSDLGSNYNPGVASGRFLRVTKEWRYSTMLVLSTRGSHSDLRRVPAPSFVY